MLKATALIIMVLVTAPVARAQTITDPGEVAAHLHFWAQERGAPRLLRGGQKRRPAKPAGTWVIINALAIAFIKYEGGVFQYAHKMWSKSSDGSCHYDDVTSRKVGNHGACVRDSDAGFGLAIGTARMTKANIDYQHSIFRTIDTNTRRVGETAACVPPKGVTAGLVSITIENGRLMVVTNRPLDYEVSIDAQDPQHPPTKPVF